MGQYGYGGAFNATKTTTDDLSLTESTVRYAERTTMAEGKVADLESRLSQLEVGSQMVTAPPQGAYYAPEVAAYTPTQPTTQIPPIINVPPQQQQYGGQHSFQQPYQPNKRAHKRGNSVAGDQDQQFGPKQNFSPQPPQFQPQQHSGGGNYGWGGGYNTSGT